MPKLARRLQPATLLLPCTGAARGSDPTPAPPGAQGFGAFAVGECGGDVCLDFVGHAPRREAGSAMKRLRGALCCGFLVLACCCSGALPESPNVVLIIGDDVGWTDFGFIGSDVVRTPHLDRLAREGIVFTHAFSPASVCRPALRSLLTGFEPYTVEIRLAAAQREKRALPTLEEVFETLPERLGERGYASFQGGKFWEGTFEMGGFTHGMTRTVSRSPAFIEDMSMVSGSEGLALGRETLQPLWDFLDAHSDRPFFVWYAPMLPHLPFDAPPRFQRLYAEDPVPPHVRSYRANLTRFDATVGEILDRLEELGLREDTLVLYVSEGKGSIYELGVRTPLVLSWPGVLAASTRDDRLVSLVDVFATILDFAGAEPVPGASGRSLLPLLLERGDFRRESVIGGRYANRPQAWFLRTRIWRYIWYPGDQPEELYEIEEDPFETRNVADAHPEQIRRFRGELARWVARTKREAKEQASKRTLER